ncbi:hypothetical protein GDO86_010464 [Hymenochirus boettgeri]|uniref:Uncharacterized protein n=1 Tax=Hymenochirus boettgeri TaxID=247094 RepID=A0A8T2JT55_9PIPI|nr:hypothetical protein GDO86_010464 [Hymenochirus boettgeri]
MGKGLLVLFLLGTCCSFVITNESSSSQEDQDVSGDDEDLSSGSGSEEILDFDDTNINVPSTAVSPSMSIFGQETTIFGRELVKEIKPVLVDPKPVVESTSHEPSTHSPTTHRPVTAKFTTVKMERSNGHIDSIHHPHHHHHHHHPHHHNTTTANPHTAADFNMPHEDTSEHPLVVVVDSHLHHILLEETTTLEPNLGKSDVQEIIDALTTEEPKNIDLIDDQIPEEGTPSGSSSTTYTEYAETTEDPSDAGGFHVVFGPDQNSTTKPSLPGVDYVATSIVPHKEKTDEEVDLVSEYITLICP